MSLAIVVGVFFHWPAVIKEPAVSDVNISAMDLFPTLSAAIGADLPAEHIYDGENLLPLLTGGDLARSADQPFYYYNCENLQAVRQGKWKLHVPRSKHQLPFWDKNMAFANLQEPVLYNLNTDKAETTNVASDNPEIVRQLTKLAESVRQDLGDFMQRGDAQRPTGSLFPDVPVISHEKDWGTVDPATANAIHLERKTRHPEWTAKTAKPRRTKKK